MSHLFDPGVLHDDVEYAAAIDELEQLLLADPDTPAGRRFDELIALIEEFDARRGGHDFWQAKRVAA
jgi:HTH-type transcriptional regulator / antitoxin HigA